MPSSTPLYHNPAYEPGVESAISESEVAYASADQMFEETSFVRKSSLRIPELEGRRETNTDEAQGFAPVYRDV